MGWRAASCQLTTLLASGVWEAFLVGLVQACSTAACKHGRLPLILGTLFVPPASIPFPQDTFQRAKTWVKELQRQASPNIVIALSGNKADLASKRMVDYEVRLCHVLAVRAVAIVIVVVALVVIVVVEIVIVVVVIVMIVVVVIMV